MKNELFKRIQLDSKSRNNKKEIIISSHKNLKQNKLNDPKLKLNITNSNLSSNKNNISEKEKEIIFQKSLTNVTIFTNKEKKLLNTKTNIKKFNLKNIIKEKDKDKEKDKENACNTDRSNKKDININKTLFNLTISTNSHTNGKISVFNRLLLSPKNKIKKFNNNIIQNNILEIEENPMDMTTEGNVNILAKHKSSQNFQKYIKFSKIKLIKNNKSNLNENGVKNNRKKTLDKNKNINIDNIYQLGYHKSFYKSNKNLVINYNSNENSRNEKNNNKINLKTYDLNKLDVIFENNIKNNKETHHYLENTISAKNKIVHKKKVPEFSSNEVDKKFKKVNNRILVKKLNIVFEKECQNEKLRNSLCKTNNNFNINKKLLENTNINNINKQLKIVKRNQSNDFKRKIFTNNTTTSNLIKTDSLKIFNKKIEDYLITKELGKGSCAVVKLATHKITKDKFAIKIYTKEFLLDPQKRNVVKNEINILKQLDNEYIMKLYEEIDTPDYLYLVLEYINGISLIDILKNEENGFLPEKRAKKLMIQIIKGIIYLHSKNICHRDIKLENILVLKNDVIKIIDFGFAVKCNKDTYQKLFCGTPSYMAPEILNKEKYIPYYCDVWSLGVLFYTMLYGRFPFDFNEKKIVDDYNEDFEKIVDIEIEFSDEIKVDENIKNIFKRIFICEAKERIKLNEILDILLCNED